MPERIDQPPEQPTPGQPVPSYAAQVLTTAAAELKRTNAGLATEALLRRTINSAVAARLHHLPAAVVRKAAARAWAAIPAGVAGNSTSFQAAVLRGVARGLR
ncbi:hypothetical protein [Streptomyces sp. LNU-CPARS28]|uniref:hypothetical protein n=1 Tax=Streptomyces sp. LNU-CPARS28 TaxID=3137371 RepID=UPI003136C88B